MHPLPTAALAERSGNEEPYAFRRRFRVGQAIRASRVDVLSGIADLRGGERWGDNLMREIDTRGVLPVLVTTSGSAILGRTGMARGL